MKFARSAESVATRERRPLDSQFNGALAIETRGLVKTFGKTRAVDGIDLQVPRGGVYGFLGPNGAGKTTAIRMFATLLKPDEGSALVLGHDVVRDASAVRRLARAPGRSPGACRSRAREPTRWWVRRGREMCGSRWSCRRR